MAIHELLQVAEQARVLPRISAEECVHARIETATCAACVEACPRDAWVLDDEQLGFDESACDGCGLCVSACPRRAISSDIGVATVWFRGRRVALLGCDRTGFDGEGVIPCVHAIGLDHLLRIYHEGVRTLLYTHADCAACPRNVSASSYPRLLGRLRTLLRSRDREPLVAHAYAPVEWDGRRRLLLRQGIADAGANTSRRDFLRDVAGRAVEQGMRVARLPLPEGRDRRVSVDHWLGSAGDEGVYPAVPKINTRHCTACNACMRVCPEGALYVEQDPPAYVVEPGYCTACRLCEPVCGERAIHIDEWVPGRAQRIVLEEHRCRSCGLMFFQVGEQEPDADGQCSICKRTDRHVNLYQVLED